MLKRMQSLSWQNLLNLASVLLFLSLMLLVWTVQNWYISLVLIPFIIGIATVVKMAYNSYKKQGFGWKKSDEIS